MVLLAGFAQMPWQDRRPPHGDVADLQSLQVQPIAAVDSDAARGGGRTQLSFGKVERGLFPGVGPIADPAGVRSPAFGEADAGVRPGRRVDHVDASPDENGIARAGYVMTPLHSRKKFLQSAGIGIIPRYGHVVNGSAGRPGRERQGCAAIDPRIRPMPCFVFVFTIPFSSGRAIGPYRSSQPVLSASSPPIYSVPMRSAEDFPWASRSDPSGAAPV